MRFYGLFEDKRDFSAFKHAPKMIERLVNEPEDCSHFRSTSAPARACVVAKGSAAMPPDLIATTSELSSGPQQLDVAARPDAQNSRSKAEPAALRIEIAVAIEITVGDSNLNVTGSIGLRATRA
jgi:hypothetical protein